MAQPYFLAIDAGTTCLKAVVMDAGGQIAAAEEVEMAGCYVAPCRLDMEALLQALAGALARLRPRCPQPWLPGLFAIYFGAVSWRHGKKPLTIIQKLYIN